MKGITLLYDPGKTEIVEEKIIPLFNQHLKRTVSYTSDVNIHHDEDDFIVTYLTDEQLKEFLPIVLEQDWHLAFLPHPGMIYAQHGFGVAEDLEDAIENIIKADAVKKVDMLMVNELPAFDTVVIGESLSVIYGSPEATRAKRNWGKIKSFFKLFKTVRLHQYTIEFNEENKEEKQSINTAALGLLVVQHGKSTLLARKIIPEPYANDGMMNILILSPQSILGLIEFGILSLFRSSKNQKLPPFAGFIKTNKIVVKSDEPMDLSVDNALISTREVVLEIMPKVYSIVPGIYLETTTKESNKEVFKTQVLPSGEQRDELLKGPLPLIHHATTEQFRELFTTLREKARPTSSYLVLMFLSTFIATLGLFSNSSPVIIGAMILAPLMAPIISLSMGVLRQDSSLIRTSLKSIGLGMLCGYLCAVLITWLTPLTTINEEIFARLRPNLLDLGIAVGSGIAGAYAHAKKEVAQTLAGVAIAVALVPPLAVSGIGLGWMDWTVFSGALLLLVTNLTGMVMSAALTFLLLGFSPFRLARKGLLVALLFVLAVSAPLAFGFTNMVRETNIVEELNGLEIEGVVLRDVNVRHMKPLRISVQVIAEKPLNIQELKHIKQNVEELVGEEVELEVTIGIKM